MKIKEGRGTYKYLIYIGCLCLLLAIGAMTAVNLISVQSVRKLVRNTMTKSITELAVSKAQLLDEKIHSELLSLQSFAAGLGAFDDLFAYPELLEDYEEKYGAARMWVIDTNGTYRDTGGMSKNFADKEELFTEALQGNEGITDVLLGELGRRQIMFQIPVYRDGRAMGGLYEAYPVESLQNVCHGSTCNDAGYSYVLNDNGSIVLALVRFSYLQMYSTIQNVLRDGENNGESIQRFSTTLWSQASGTAVFDLKEEKRFLTFMPLTQKHS